MPRFTTASVAELLLERPGLQRIALDNGRRAYVLTELLGPVAVGDEVVVNATAVDLGLGTGGWDVVHWNLSRREWDNPGAGHILKLRYTSLQADVAVVEGEGSLDGKPVVACFLHSQLAAVAAAFRHGAPGKRLAYVMTDTAALPLALSDLVADGLFDVTVTAGQAFGGDLEAVNVASALVGTDADAVVVGPGPGVVGTDTTYGFSSLDVAATVDLVHALGGLAILAPRYSDADPRERHRGMSHHTTTVLELVQATPLMPVPDDGPELDITATTMGRSAADDPGFFAYAAAAGVAAARSVMSTS
ncbi:MAG TPA: DUF3866 family protein [Acidimicrobiales bacterium]|nr:DUF3866 family protein [Acidimicrobiales bacterium]